MKAPRVCVIDRTTLPKTFAEIDRQFSTQALRKEVKAAAVYGTLKTVGKRGGPLSPSAKTGLEVVQEILSIEYAAAGFDLCFVEESEPGVVVAYLDQPK